MESSNMPLLREHTDLGALQLDVLSLSGVRAAFGAVRSPSQRHIADRVPLKVTTLHSTGGMILLRSSEVSVNLFGNRTWRS